jgi:hypothetical protein
MKRIELFEFEDQNWFPTWLRTSMTNLINVLLGMLGTSEVLAEMIAEILQKQKLLKIVDLGSGSGGAMPLAVKTLHEIEGMHDVELVMTDLYPSPEIIAKFNQNTEDKISFLETPVDATDIAATPKGLKTMVNSFHHMSPKAARKILESAENSQQPLLIYEMAENKIPLLVWVLLLPLSLPILMIMVLFMTPFVKPLTWRQVVFTYLIPIIPICYAWDGQASLPRMYTLKDMDQLLDGLGSERYTWKKGNAKKKNGKKMGTFVLGLPTG